MNSKRIVLMFAVTLAVGCTSQAGSSPEDSKEVRAKAVLDRYHDKYGDAIDEVTAALGGDGTSEPIEKEIADACGSGHDGRGTEEDQQGMAFAMMLFTPTLQKHGQNWVDFVNDTAKVNIEIQQIAGCR